jgi:hypothetical protein
MPVSLVTWEAEIGRILVAGQPRQKVSETLVQPITRCGGVHLSSQVHRKHKEEDSSLRLAQTNSSQDSTYK